MCSPANHVHNPYLSDLSHMARYCKDTVEHFPHLCSPSDSLQIIDKEYDRGYEFWFRLLEKLGMTPGHYLDIRKASTWETLVSRSRMPDDTTRACLDRMSVLEMIDPELYAQGIIWIQNFVDGVNAVYQSRRKDPPSRPTPRQIAESRGESPRISENLQDSPRTNQNLGESRLNKLTNKLTNLDNTNTVPADAGLSKKSPEPEKPKPSPQRPPQRSMNNKSDFITINRQQITGSFIRTIYRNTGGDWDQTFRILFRARLADNVRAYINAGLQENSDPEKSHYILKPCAEESSNPGLVKKWIDINIVQKWSGYGSD